MVPGGGILDLGNGERRARIGFRSLIVSTHLFLATVLCYAHRIGGEKDCVGTLDLIHIQVLRMDFGYHDETFFPFFRESEDPLHRDSALIKVKEEILDGRCLFPVLTPAGNHVEKRKDSQ